MHSWGCSESSEERYRTRAWLGWEGHRYQSQCYRRWGFRVRVQNTPTYPCFCFLDFNCLWPTTGWKYWDDSKNKNSYALASIQSWTISWTGDCLQLIPGLDGRVLVSTVHATLPPCQSFGSHFATSLFAFYSLFPSHRILLMVQKYKSTMLTIWVCPKEAK